MWVFSVLVLSSHLFGQLVTDPLPYAAIANPLPDCPDTMSQLKRDSLNLTISPIRVNQAGYRPEDEKLFYYVGDSATTFSVVDAATNSQVATGSLASTGSQTAGQLKMSCYYKAQLVPDGAIKYSLTSQEASGTVFKGNIPDLPVGRYKVKVGSDVSAPFVINQAVYSWVRDALLKYFGVSRCGPNESWFHPSCHIRDVVPGGWHDAGDHLKMPQSIGYVMSILGLSASALKDRDNDSYSKNQAITRPTDGIPDVLAELKVGTDYISSAYDIGGQNVQKMKTEIGAFTPDHMWWGRPEYQDNVPVGRGGPPRESKDTIGGNTAGSITAGMAFMGKLYEKYDPVYSAKCLKIARELYAYGKAHPATYGNTAMQAGGMTYDELALGALALWWATKDTVYRYDMLYNPTLGTKASTWFKKGAFKGGWFAYTNPAPQKGLANTCWDNLEVYALWGLYRLILKDEETALSYGIDKAERLTLIEDILYSQVNDIGDISEDGADQTITLPASDMNYKKNTLKCSSLWGYMWVIQGGSWMPNRYQAGNIAELFCYYDIASKMQGTEFPNTPATTDWKANEVKSVLLKQLDYMLGLNPWDVSFVTGIGSKNLNHPHHRSSNPELQNVPGAFYNYRPLVGALSAGYLPTIKLYDEYMGGNDGYYHTEVSLDATAALFLPVMGLGKEDTLKAPGATVRIVYIGCDNAVIEVRQDRYGRAELHYGVNNTTQIETSDSLGVFHRFELTNLSKGTTYNFSVKVSDLFGRDSVMMNIDENKNPVLFSFTTLQTCPTNAEITKVKICKVTSDSADIFWYTPNGEFDSKIVYGTSKPPTTTQNGDIAGHPVKFHNIKIGGLKEQTTYYFYVQSGTSIDDNSGAYYQFTTPVEHVNFDIRALRYTWGGMPALGMNIINQDVKAYDSLDVRIYFRAKDGFERDLGARLDIGIIYDEAGYQQNFGEDVDKINNVKRQKPTRMEDTYNAADSTYAYYLSVPLWGVMMKSGSRIRLDVIFDRRSSYFPYEDLMNQAPVHIINDNDWSFGPHLVDNGAPFDYPGVLEGTKDDVDNNYTTLPINYYMTVYRKGEFVWGYSPSKIEQSTKKTYYEMVSQVTSPVNNPSEDYIYTENASVVVEGHAAITPIDGKINDIWVNGVALANTSSYVTWNTSKQWYDFSIPVKLKNGRNPVVITLFGGPSETCTDCYGCTNSTHSFYVESGAQQYPSTISLRDKSLNPLPNDTAHIDTTVFHAIITDRNGNLRGKLKDSIYVMIKNPLALDSIRVKLIETGDSTGIFQTISPISIVNLPASQTGADQISMNGGEKIWITYIDSTDPTDSSVATLVSNADFPVANNGAIFDSNGDGAIDRMVIIYSIPLKSTPDSASFGIPTIADLHVLHSNIDNFKVSGNQLEITFATPLDKGITGFSSGTKSTAKSHLTNQGSGKTSIFSLHDSVGPVIAAPVLLYEKSSPGDDTLTIYFSEAINMGTKKDSVLMVKHDGKVYGISLIGIIGSDQSTRSMTIIVKSIGITLQEGDSLYINPYGSLTDNATNHAHKDNPKMPFILKAAPPQAKSAFYTDSNADGMIDYVEITFSKKVNIDDIAFGFKWNNGSKVTASKGSVGYVGSDSTVVSVRIKGLLTGTDIITYGDMALSAVHSSFPNNTITCAVDDHAAPVIDSAQFAPSGQADGTIIDTLTVTFSEPVNNITSEQPFAFLSMPNKSPYSMKMVSSNKGESSKKIFYVSSYSGIDYPGLEDSIRIDISTKVTDMSGNTQEKADNRFAPMKAKPVPFTVTLTQGPNPFTIDKTEILTDNDLPNELLNKKGTLIILNPESRIKRKITIRCTIDIFDAMGNKVLSKEFTPGNQSSKIYFVWNGYNLHGRVVGSGTYIGTLTIHDEIDRVVKKKIKIGVKR